VLPRLVTMAKAHGAVVGMTAGDARVMGRHRQSVLAALEAGVDMLFTNAAEALELVQPPAVACQEGPLSSPAEDSEDSTELSVNCMPCSGLEPELSPLAAAKLLATHCPLVAVTDGSRGSYISALGNMLVVPPCWMGSPPVDTCGAGDAYLGGFLYGFLNDTDLYTMGQAAARTASAVIGRQGPQLSSDDALAVVKTLGPALDPSGPMILSGIA